MDCQSGITTPQKLAAIVDVIMGQPFTESIQTSVDGDVSYIFTPRAIGGDTIGCAEEVAGLVWYLYFFLASCLVSLVIYSPGTLYRQYQVVRNGLNDYIALNETSSVPQVGVDWALIRSNIQGPQGPSGEEPYTETD